MVGGVSMQVNESREVTVFTPWNPMGRGMMLGTQTAQERG